MFGPETRSDLAGRGGTWLELAGDALAAGGDTGRIAQQTVRAAVEATGAQGGTLWRTGTPGQVELLASSGAESGLEAAAGLVREFLGTWRPVAIEEHPDLPGDATRAATVSLGQPAFGVLQLYFLEETMPPDARAAGARRLRDPGGARPACGGTGEPGRGGARADARAARGRRRGDRAPLARTHARDRGGAHLRAARRRARRRLSARRRAAARRRGARVVGRARGGRRAAARGRARAVARSRRRLRGRRRRRARARRAAGGARRCRAALGARRAAARARRLDRAAGRLSRRAHARRERHLAAHVAGRPARGRRPERATARAVEGARRGARRGARDGAPDLAAGERPLRDLPLVRAEPVARHDARRRHGDDRRRCSTSTPR